MFTQSISRLGSRLLLVCAAFSVWPGAGGPLVLCRGMDGHLEIESAQGGRCTECLVTDVHDEAGLVDAEAAHCGACTDTVITLSEEAAQRARTAAPAAAALPATAPFAAMRAQALLRAAPAHGPPPAAWGAGRCFLRFVRLLL